MGFARETVSKLKITPRETKTTLGETRIDEFTVNKDGSFFVRGVAPIIMERKEFTNKKTGEKSMGSIRVIVIGKGQFGSNVNGVNLDGDSVRCNMALRLSLCDNPEPASNDMVTKALRGVPFIAE
jgi:hypothetical protein